MADEVPTGVEERPYLDRLIETWQKIKGEFKSTGYKFGYLGKSDSWGRVDLKLAIMRRE